MEAITNTGLGDRSELFLGFYLREGADENLALDGRRRGLEQSVWLVGIFCDAIQANRAKQITGLRTGPDHGSEKMDPLDR